MHHLKGAPLLRRTMAAALAVALVFGLAGCQQGTQDGTTPSADAEKTELVLASTTSTQDSGLFDELIPAFEEANPQYEVKVVAVGTGEALELGRNKDADVLLVHAKADEETFVAEGFGVERADVMYNDFIVVGPEADPAGLKSATDATSALKALAAAGKAGDAKFISRGDDSGTHKKELKIWATASVTPTPTPEADDWYEETGQGMGETLTIASEEAAYTLADRATFLAQQDALDLTIVLEKDETLLNQYGVIVVTDARSQEGGQAFYDWVLSDEGQQVIGEFGVETYGQQLFVPNAQ